MGWVVIALTAALAGFVGGVLAWWFITGRYDYWDHKETIARYRADYKPSAAFELRINGQTILGPMDSEYLYYISKFGRMVEGQDILQTNLINGPKVELLVYRKPVKEVRKMGPEDEKENDVEFAGDLNKDDDSDDDNGQDVMT